MTIYFITSKKEKFEEAKAIIPELQQKDIDLTEIQSLDSMTIIMAKLEEAKKHIKGSILVEDASVECEALNNFPGPLAKWMIQAMTIQEIYPLIKDKKITYRATVGLWHKGEVHYFEGTVEGKVVKPKGQQGWHWDPIFLPNGSKKTFAEMSKEEKNSYSHRGKAFQKLKEFLTT
jgi:non-canonical purine NTP pyrophosphatase (RdgB/HAM1 family)